MRALVTGGLGFIGSHVVDLLIEQGHQVDVIDNLSGGDLSYANPKAPIHQFDVLNTDAVKKLCREKKFDWVFHLAALPQIQPSFENPILHDDVNVRGALSLFEAVKSEKIKALVYSSSSAVYGDTQIVPTPETAPIEPLSPYALQKYSAERYLQILGQRYSVPVTTLRYFNVYGPRSFNPKNKFNAYTSVVGIFERQKASGQPLTITGDGAQTRDFVHVQDVARANVIVAEKIDQSQGEVFNVGTGQAISILQLAEMFHHPIRHIEERPGEIKHSCADSGKLRGLGWIAKQSIESCI